MRLFPALKRFITLRLLTVLENGCQDKSDAPGTHPKFQSRLRFSDR
jgi:hypothetical protein